MRMVPRARSPLVCVAVFLAAWLGEGAWLETHADLDRAPAGAAAGPESASPEVRRSIDRGFEWLVGAIRGNGTVGPDRDQGPDLGCTAIAGLALLSEGSTPRGGRYSQQSRRLLYGLLELLEQREAGTLDSITLIQRKIGRNADLFLAAIYLSEVYYESPGDERLIRAALVKLVRHIGETQGPDGTWGTESWAPVLGTVLGWESLRAADAAGFQVTASAKRVGTALLKTLKEKSPDDESWMHRFYKEASSLRVLYSLDLRQEQVFRDSIPRLMSAVRGEQPVFELAGGEEYLAFYLVTECLVQDPRPEWRSWYPDVSAGVVKMQNRDGSWTGHHCITDRTFCTASALLTLLAPRHQLSLSDL